MPVRVRLPAPFTARARPGAVLAARLTIVSGRGGGPGPLAEDAARVRDLKATEPRPYHTGPASSGDPAALRSALPAL